MDVKRCMVPKMSWKQFRERGYSKDYDSQTAHGCICPSPGKNPDGSWDWKIDENCNYHATAARYPDNHGIPWNCHTYYDGCNCKNTLKTKKILVEELMEVLEGIASCEWQSCRDCRETANGTLARVKEKRHHGPTG